jgi:hypothetical protein
MFNFDYERFSFCTQFLLYACFVLKCLATWLFSVVKEQVASGLLNTESGQVRFATTERNLAVNTDISISLLIFVTY